MFLHLKEESGFRAGKFCEPPPCFATFQNKGMDTLMSMAGLWIFYLWNRATQIELFTDLHQPWARAGWRGARCELPRAGRQAGCVSPSRDERAEDCAHGTVIIHSHGIVSVTGVLC